MKLGYSTLGSPNWSVEQVIDAAQQFGYDGVELRMIRGTVDLYTLPEFKPDRIAATYKQFAENGVEVFCVDTSIRLAWLASARREEQLDQARTMFDLAKSLSSSYVRVFGGELDEPVSPPDHLPIFREQLATLVDIGEQAGVKVLLETHDSFSTGESIAALIANEGAEISAGVLWDVLHSYRHQETFEETFNAIGAYLELVHIKDSAKFSDSEFDLKLVGEGIVPIADAVQLLARKDYQGYLCFEWEKGWHPEIEEPEVALPHYAKTMRDLLKTIQ